MAAQTYRPATNGAAVFTIRLAEGLARAGHRVLVLMPSDRVRPYRSMLNGVEVCTVTALPLRPLRADIYVTPRPGREVGPLLDAFRPDVVHVQDHYPLCRGVVRAAGARGLALVGTSNFLPDNLLSQMPVPAGVRGLLERLLWRTVRAVFDRVDVVTAASETSAAILRAQGLRPPVCAISSGVDLRRFRPDPGIDRAAVRRRYGLDPERVLFLFVSRLDPEKRVDLLLWALHRLGRDDLQVAVAGRGTQLGAWRALAEALGLGERVVFTGFVPGRDLPALLASADVFLMPGEAELQSIATLEAMACGRPVLAADARALPELVESGVNGYLFRAGDPRDLARAMARMMDERARWPAMGAASAQKAAEHDLERTVSRYQALYQEVCRAGI